jgi:hypothetical protein
MCSNSRAVHLSSRSGARTTSHNNGNRIVPLIGCSGVSAAEHPCTVLWRETIQRNTSLWRTLAPFAMPTMSLERGQNVINPIEQLRLLERGRYRHTHYALGQSHIGEDATLLYVGPANVFAAEQPRFSAVHSNRVLGRLSQCCSQDPDYFFNARLRDLARCLTASKFLRDEKSNAWSVDKVRIVHFPPTLVYHPTISFLDPPVDRNYMKMHFVVRVMAEATDVYMLWTQGSFKCSCNNSED